jgi:hypothetical protein
MRSTSGKTASSISIICKPIESFTPAKTTMNKAQRFLVEPSLQDFLFYFYLLSEY